MNIRINPLSFSMITSSSTVSKNNCLYYKIVKRHNKMLWQNANPNLPTKKNIIKWGDKFEFEFSNMMFIARQKWEIINMTFSPLSKCF